MSTRQNRRTLSVLNDTLRNDCITLKNKHMEVSSQVDNLIRKEKQLHALKEQLQDELEKAQIIVAKQSKANEEKCYVIRGQIDTLLQKLQANEIALANLQAQYQLCLKEYDTTLADVTKIIQQTRVMQIQYLQQKEKNETINSMVFDYERLKRVLEQEKKYFKQLLSTQAKSHAERMRQLEMIASKLNREQNQTINKARLEKVKIGFMKTFQIMKKRNNSLLETFFHKTLRYQQITELGISKLKNCFMLSQKKYSQQMKYGFSVWRKAVFPSDVLNNIVEKALQKNLQSRSKIKALGNIIQLLNKENLNLLHLYERTKVLTTTFNSNAHKDKHLAFNLWRENSKQLTLKAYYMDKITTKIYPRIACRIGLNKWRESTNLQKRLDVACHLLEQYEQTRQLSRGLRTWRLQLCNREQQLVTKYVDKLKTHQLIQSRIGYQKRKVKAITSLQLSMGKIKLRNYFIRYYENVKQLKLNDINQSTQETKDILSKARLECKTLSKQLKAKNLRNAMEIFQKFLSNQKMNPAFKKWKNNAYYLTQRNKALMIIALKKEARNKLHCMNEFRKNVQNYQKKQMHLVLTDLNNKMQAINEKSTQFREALRRIIQSLGEKSSKRINEVFEYTTMCQKKVYFNWHTRLSIRMKFKGYILAHALRRLENYGQRIAFKQILNSGKGAAKENALEKKLVTYNKKSQRYLLRKCFNAIFTRLNVHKKAFERLFHIQKVFYLYRLEFAMINLRKKAHQQRISQQQKVVEQLSTHLKAKSQIMKVLQTDKSTIQGKLQGLFKKFLVYQDLSMRNQNMNHLEKLKKKYFKAYRANVRNLQHQEQTLRNFAAFFEYKNYFIFWKNLLATKYEKQQTTIREQLSRNHKKKKLFEQKTQNSIKDIERKLSQEQQEHHRIQSKCQYINGKYQQILSYYDRNHIKKQSRHLLRTVFGTWKGQYIGSKRLGNVLVNICFRRTIVEPYRLVFACLKKYDQRLRAQLIFSKFLNKKGRQILKDGMNYWRYNMRHGYCQSIKYRVDNIDDYYAEMKFDAFAKAEKMADQVIYNKQYDLKSVVFMAFKNELTNVLNSKKKIAPLQKAISNRRLANAMKNWKWLLFYKKTKRSYLRYKKQSYQHSLKSDVFSSLKIHREELILFQTLIHNYAVNQKYQFLKYSFNKLVKYSVNEHYSEIYKRRRHLHALLMNKITHEKMIKRKIMWKWQSWLIPKHHYLPNVIKNIELRIMRSTFASINERKYRNTLYVKKIAEHITNQGYSEVNAIKNIIVSEGFDPDELKDFLKMKNQKDKQVMSKVIKHIKAWPQKQKLVRALHSWKQFVEIKRNIKLKLTKVLNSNSGLGRYWNKWRMKDPAFNAILQRQSRINMLQRYKDLERLMKEYHLDIKESKKNCQDLRQINNQNARSTISTLHMAISNMNSNVRKGMKQGFNIWRSHAQKLKGEERNIRYEQLADDIELLDNRKRDLRERIIMIQSQNKELKNKCKWGSECGELLKNLACEKDNLTIDLAEKQHNLKIMLEDNLRLKQKIKAAKQNAINLIRKVQQSQN